MEPGIRGAIGEVLRRLREGRGLTLVDIEASSVERGARVSRARLSEIERGEAPIHLEDLVILGRLYGIDPGALFLEAESVAPTDMIDLDKSPEALFEEGKLLYRHGKPLDAGWSFDAAYRASPEEDRDFRCLLLTSSAHAFETCGMLGLALRRSQEALDVLENEAPTRLRAIAKAAQLLARVGCRGRAYLYLTLIDTALEEDRPAEADFQAWLLHYRGLIRSRLDGGDERSLADLRAAGRIYKQIGTYHRSAMSLAVAADVLIARRETEAALRHARDAVALVEQTDDVEARLYVRGRLASVLMARSSWDEAKDLIRQILQEAEPLGLIVHCEEAYLALADIAKRRGTNAEHARWLRKARGIGRSGSEGRHSWPRHLDDRLGGMS